MSDVRWDIHGVEKRLTGALRLLESDPRVSDLNRNHIKRFLEECVTQGVGPARRVKYTYELRELAAIHLNDLAVADIQAVKHMVAEIERRPLSRFTRDDYRKALKKFYRWLRGVEKPPEVSWFKLPGKESNKLPEDLLDENEMKRLIQSCANTMQRALLSFLYETGCRIGEVLTLRVGDVRFDSIGGIAIVDGKTGLRRVRFIWSVPEIQQWLNSHPRPADATTPLWLNHRGRALRYGPFLVSLRATARRAGIQKRVHPHLFRHSRATFLANHFTDAQMKAFLGWSKNSAMPSVYIHLSGRDIDDALLKVNGIQPAERPKSEPVLALRECKRCHLNNPPTGSYCGRCGMPLSEEEATKLLTMEAERQRAEGAMSSLLKDPEVKLLLTRKLTAGRA